MIAATHICLLASKTSWKNVSGNDPSTFALVFSHSTLPELTKHHTFHGQQTASDPEDFMSLSLLDPSPRELLVKQRSSNPESVISITGSEHCPTERPMTPLDCEFSVVLRKQCPTVDEK